MLLNNSRGPFYKKARVSYLRALAIGTLIDDAVSLFIENEASILDGSFGVSLLERSRYKAQMDDIIKLSIDKVYNSDEVIDKELSGFEVINELLFRFSNAVNNCYYGTGSHYDKLILKLFDSELDYKNDKLYNRMMAVCSLVASYSDSNAILIYRKIKGLEF